MTSTGTPAVLDAVRELERSLDGAADGHALAAQRVRDARQEAAALLAEARHRGATAAERVRTELLAAGERQIAAINAAAEAQVALLDDELDRHAPRLAAELRAIVLPTGHERARG